MFVVEEKPHDTYRREGNDLVHRLPITLEQALKGLFALVLPTLDGRQLRVQVEEMIHPGMVKVLKGEGMPNPKARDGSTVIRRAVTEPSLL